MTWLNWPNRITVARIVLVGPLVICLLNLNDPTVPWRWITLGLVLLMALSDALDGFVARRFHAESALGAFLDPVADKLFITSALIILAIDATAIPVFRIPSWVPVVAIGKDLVVITGFLLIYASTGRFYLRPHIWGKACTTLQLLLVGYVLAGPTLPAQWRFLVPVLSWAGGALAVIAAADYIRVGNRFTNEHHANSQRPNA